MSELKDYAVIVFEGEGYYSGSCECNTLFIKKSELAEEIEDFLSDTHRCTQYLTGSIQRWLVRRLLTLK